MALTRMVTICLAAAVASLAPGTGRADPAEPLRGSELRQTLLDTIHPIAEYELGAPVEFVVIEMLTEGDLAFARLRVQRPGGVPIDMAATPIVTRRFADPMLIDGPRFEVFYVRRAGRWAIREYALGATDARWFAFECE